jgi:hypothetical protein
MSLKPLILCLNFLSLVVGLFAQNNHDPHLDSNQHYSLSFTNYLKKGNHQIEVSMDEKQLWNFGLRTGLHTFQHLLILGVQSGQPNLIYTYGYGLGTQMPLQKNRLLALDLSAQQLNAANAPNNKINLLVRWYMGILYPVNNKLDISIGPTADFGIFNTKSSTFKKYFAAYSSNYSFSEKVGDTDLRFWIGIRASVRVR